MSEKKNRINIQIEISMAIQMSNVTDWLSSIHGESFLKNRRTHVTVNSQVFDRWSTSISSPHSDIILCLNRVPRISVTWNMNIYSLFLQSKKCLHYVTGTGYVLQIDGTDRQIKEIWKESSIYIYTFFFVSLNGLRWRLTSQFFTRVIISFWQESTMHL